MRYNLVLDDITYSGTISPFGDPKNLSYLIDCDEDSYLTAEQYGAEKKWCQTGGHSFTAPLLDELYKKIEDANEAELMASYKTPAQADKAIIEIQYNAAIHHSIN